MTVILAGEGVVRDGALPPDGYLAVAWRTADTLHPAAPGLTSEISDEETKVTEVERRTWTCGRGFP